MFCEHCGKNIPSDSKFCQSCGKISSIHNINNVDNNNYTICQICGIKAPTKYNAFYANIGMLFARRQMEIKANMCRGCSDKYFWKYTFTNLLLGWWGIISFFATWIFLIMNTYQYLFTLKLKKYY